MTTRRCITGILAGTLAGTSAFAQPIAPEARQRVIDQTLTLIEQRYVFPDVAEKMAQSVRGKADFYEKITEARQLATQLTADLQAISRDKHLHVDYSEHPQPLGTRGGGQPAGGSMSRSLARDNYGVTRVEVLPGNIGYVAFRFLASARWAGDAYAALMNYLAHTDALILDLRACRGSMPDAIPLLASYFFDDAVHLVSFYDRPSNTTTQAWTYAYVPGKRYLEKPVFVLTSSATFSGGEELAYDLQTLKRATLVGEVTGGGANPGRPVRVDEHFSVWIPIGRAISPVTHTNWEGVGVQPDRVTAAALALHQARRMALDSLIQKNTADPDWQQRLHDERRRLEQLPLRFVKRAFVLKGFPDARQVVVTGSFNFWHRQANSLTRSSDGWRAEVELEPGEHAYNFIVDGQWITDPANPRTRQEGNQVNSVVFVGENQ